MSMVPDGLAFKVEADMAAVAAMMAARVAAGARSLLVLVGDDVKLPTPEFERLLRDQPVRVFGGVFPRVVVGGRALSNAVIVVGLNTAVHVGVVERLSVTPLSSERVRAAWGEEPRPASLMVWVDALSPGLSSLVEFVFDAFGVGPTYLGGGVGTTYLESKPCLFTNTGVFGDAALIVGFPERIGVGADHGWQALAGPFLVTGAHANVIDSLDYRPALDVYGEAVNQFSSLPLDPGSIRSVASGFPFGLERMDGSLIVREPVMAIGTHLMCVGDVPQQSSIHVLRGETASLIGAARQACMQACSQVPQRASAALVVTSNSRALFLQDAFGDELTAVRAVLEEWGHAGVPVFGVLSLGEIANTGNHCLEYFNKTFALGLIP